jgi:hypothetical protein
MTEDDSMDMALAIGFILGNFAGKKTIVINAGNAKEPPFHIYSCDISNLFEVFFLKGGIPAVDFLNALVKKYYCLGAKKYDTSRHYSYLPGLVNFTYKHSRLIGGHVGEAFIKEIISKCMENQFEYVVVDFSNTIYSLRANLLVSNSSLFCLKFDMEQPFLMPNENLKAIEGLNSRHFFDRHMPQIKELFLYSDDILNFPEEGFLESLTDKSDDIRNAASKVAVRALSRIEKDIQNKLFDNQGKKVKVKL